MEHPEFVDKICSVPKEGSWNYHFAAVVALVALKGRNNNLAVGVP
jgi:hypothetical protein